MADAEALLREKLEKARSSAFEDVPIVGMEDVVVRYQALPRDTFEELQDRGPGEGNISLLIRACQAILIRDDAGELVSIDDQAHDRGTVTDDGTLAGRHVTYSSDRTLEILGVSDARAAVVKLHPREGAIDHEAMRVTQLSGYGTQAGERGPERRSRATRS